MRSPIIPILVALTIPLVGCTSSGVGPHNLPVPPKLPGLACLEDTECPPALGVYRSGTQVPVYEVRDEPIYEERRTPIWGEKSVPIYQTRRAPVTAKLWDPCSKCDNEVELWDKEERVQVGVQRVRACLGYKTERVRVGSCPTRVRVGWKSVEDGPTCP